MNHKLQAIIFIVLSVLLARMLRNLYNKDMDTALDCHKVLDGVAFGPEDFAVSYHHNIIFVSSHNRRDLPTEGKLYAVDLYTETEIVLSVKYPPNFRPHGMTIFESDERSRIFVISHRFEDSIRHCVEVFDFFAENNELVHIDTLFHSLLISPNDLHATNFNELLISSDHCTNNIGLQLLHDVVEHKCSDIIYFHGAVGDESQWLDPAIPQWSTFGLPVAFGNGIITVHENNEEYLIRSSSVEYAIYNYTVHRDSRTHHIKHLSLNYIDHLSFSPDNIELDIITNNLIITGHYSTYSFFALHAILRMDLSPTIVILYKDRKYKLLYANHGRELSGGSVAVRNEERQLFIGQVFNPYVLSCKEVI